MIESIELKEGSELPKEAELRRIEALAEDWDLEPGIKDAVVALNVLGLPTTNSCEGHDDHGRGVPWVTVGAPGFPKERYIGQKEFEERVYAANGVSKDLLEREAAYIKEFDERKGSDIDTFEKLHEELRAKYNILNKDSEKITDVFFSKIPPAVDRAVKDGILKEENPQYVQWSRLQKELYERASGLLEEFYRERETPDRIRLILIEDFRKNSFFIRNDGGGDYLELDEERTKEEAGALQKKIESRTSEEKAQINKRLGSYRKEFDEFADFLKDKFLNS